MFSEESPHRGESNEYTQHTILNIEKKLILNYPRSAAKFSDKVSRDFSKGLKNEFETAVVNEPSVFEPLKFYCISIDTPTLQARHWKLPSTIAQPDQDQPR